MTTANYGTGLYGVTARKYGATAGELAVRWGLDIDWTGAGYTGDNEAVNMVDLRVKRGRDTYLNIDGEGNASGFEPVRVGTATVTLDNTTRRYDPYNTASPIYPNVLPGRFVRIRVLYNGAVYPVFTGKIKNITSIDNEQEQKVTLELEDGLRHLQNADTSVQMQTDIDIDNAIGLILDDIEYPSRWGRNLEDSADVLSYWWSENKAVGEIRDLTDAEIGKFFIAADGKATFQKRDHTSSPVLTLTSADFLKAIDIPQPLSVIRNSVKIKAHPKVNNAGVELWRMQDFPAIAANDTFTVWATYTYNGQTVPALNVVTPLRATDFTINTAADGSGADLTGYCDITFTNFGKTAKIIIRNNSIYAGYITLLKVRGDAVTNGDTSLLVYDDTASQTAYGKALLSIDNEWIQETSHADLLAADLISYLPDPQRFVTVRIEASPDIQFVPDLFDTVTVTISKLSISGVVYNVAGITHEWIFENGQATKTTWTLEPT